MIAIWATTPMHSASERRMVEDAVVIRLGALLRSNGGFLKALRAFNGEIDEDNADDFYRELQGESPAILVSTSTGRYDEGAITARAVTNVLTVDILVVSSTLSGHKERTRGDVATADEDVVDYGDPGIYYMLAKIRQGLMGRQTGVEGAGVLRPVTEQQLYSTQNLTAWRAVYRIPVRIAQPRDTEDDAPLISELEHQHFNHDELADRDTLVARGIATAAPD